MKSPSRCQRGRAEKREALRARHRLGEPVGEIEGLVTGKENPRPCLDRISVGETGAYQVLDGLYLGCRH